MTNQSISDVRLTYSIDSDGFAGTKKSFEKTLTLYFQGLTDSFFPNNPAQYLPHPSGFYRYTLRFHANYSQLRWLESFGNLLADHIRARRIEGILLIDYQFSVYPSKSLNSGLNLPFKESTSETDPIQGRHRAEET